ncbi:MAG TPA: cyclase family protein [Thermoanaerobaculaceae bacterium]|nr:cyclase family protein [Thermoanaerobaculaceae bacterium]HRS16470.1 cyclase family protein [Thermoanaerobaculaceae bacterium]
MPVVDLSHAIATDTPVYPGTPPVRREALATLAEHGFAETLLTLTTHTGTHIDAPAHLLPGALTLDLVPPERFVGRACVLDLPAAPREVQLGALEAHARRLAGCTMVLLRTGWDRHWGQPAYLEGFPVLSLDAARWLATLGLAAVGVDAVSFDRLDAGELPVHRLLLGAGVLLVENLTRLDRLPVTGLTFCCLPLPVADADGAPCRAVAMLP